MKSVKRMNKTQPPTEKKVYEFEVGGRIGRFFNAHNWGAFTFPLPFVVLLLYWSTEDEPDGEVGNLHRVHEFVHVEQDAANWCFAVTWVKYLWESLRHLTWASIRTSGLRKALLDAYYANAFEAEAYMVTELAAKNGLPEWAR